MGRTNPTYRDALSAIEREWSDYRRALRRRDRAHFDRLFAHAREHADAAGARNHTDPVVPLLLSVALAQERRIAELSDRTERLETAVVDDDGGGDVDERGGDGGDEGRTANDDRTDDQPTDDGDVTDGEPEIERPGAVPAPDDRH